jgi:hypothetical protein
MVRLAATNANVTYHYIRRMENAVGEELNRAQMTILFTSAFSN